MKKDEKEAISETGTKLINAVLNFTLHPEKINVLDDVLSADMMKALQNIVDTVLNGILDKHPDLPEILGDEDFEKFKNSLYEAIGLGAKIYWAEYYFIKKDHVFIKYKGIKFQNYLYKAWSDYFIANNRSLEELIDEKNEPYILECVNYFGLQIFKYRYLEGDNLEIFMKIAKADDDNATITKDLNLYVLINSFILNGYVMCRVQDEYREIAGIPESKQAEIDMNNRLKEQ